MRIGCALDVHQGAHPKMPFKFLVKSHGFRLMDYPVLGLSNVLCLPAKPQKKGILCCSKDALYNRLLMLLIG